MVFFNLGETMACFRLGDSKPSENDELHMQAIMGARVEHSRLTSHVDDVLILMDCIAIVR